MSPESSRHSGSSSLRLRALAHPLRWKLIDLLDSEGTATATRCAEATGESVASCSYHLGVLAKYQYIQLVPGISGREKPWRLTSPHQDLSPPGPDLEDQLAAEAATEVFLDHELERLKSRVRSLGLEPPEWYRASSGGGSTMWVTAAELGEIKDELLAVLHRYEGRGEDPSQRPAGSREARVFVSTSVDPRK